MVKKLSLQEIISMIKFSENVSLRNLNTFRIEAQARYYYFCTDPEQIPEVLAEWPQKESLLIMGGGSNLLFTRNFEGLVLRIGFTGIQMVHKNKEYVIVEAAAGENWDEFVDWTVERNFGGLENLSLIPGTVGASPVQNIGAYGTEAGNSIESVTYYSIDEKTIKTLPSQACGFGYRTSIFKNQMAGNSIILSVRFRLSLHPVLNTEYKGLKEEMRQYAGPGIRAVRQAVIAIRRRKLPDPAQVGNAGSFFKNPVVPEEDFSALVKENPDIPFFPAGKGFVKIPAAWLIEKCGWKGYRKGDAGVHPHQPLVLVNYGAAAGREILELANAVQASVYQQFGINLEPEVRII